MENIKKQKTKVHTSINSDQKLSIADELFKLAKLKEQGIINEAEFLKMKQDILKM